MKSGLRFNYIALVICVMLKTSTGEPLDEVKQPNTGELIFKTLNEDYAKEIAALKKEIYTLQERVTELESKSSNTNKGLITTDALAEGIKDSNHILRKRAVRRIRIAPEVAFQASLTKESVTVKLYDTIIFNNVITNIGRAYNKDTGVFTAPIAGTYTFNTNIVSGKGHYVEASIQVNNRVTVSAISDHRLPGENKYFTTWDQGNAVAILKLNRGDKVFVSVQWPQGSHVIHGIGKSSFSGYLLRAHERR